jgi:hypothetical protein
VATKLVILQSSKTPNSLLLKMFWKQSVVVASLDIEIYSVVQGDRKNNRLCKTNPTTLHQQSARHTLQFVSSGFFYPRWHYWEGNSLEKPNVVMTHAPDALGKILFIFSFRKTKLWAYMSLIEETITSHKHFQL